MRYRARHAERRLRLLSRHFRVVLVTGARQVGKSTLLRHTLRGVRALVFDPVQDLYGTRSDPDLFLDSFPPPLILDEIQFVPGLLPALKRRVDRLGKPGQYFLTGSQNLSVLRSVSESMAGRVAVLSLEAMSMAELMGEGGGTVWLDVYLRDPDSLPGRLLATYPRDGALVRRLWRGGLPGLLDTPDALVPDFFRSYVQTYIDRDVRTIEDIRALAEFGRFLGLLGALTGQETNLAQLGREIGIAQTTARRWLDLITNNYQWLELPPYHGSAIKRLSGRSKGFIRDTGLACYLQRISSPEALAVSPLLGAIFETWVVNDVHRQRMALGSAPNAYHWRTNGGAEVDLLFERDGWLYPIEVKCKTTVTRHDARGLRAFRETYPRLRIAPGLIVYAGTECYRVDEKTIALPWNARIAVRGRR